MLEQRLSQAYGLRERPQVASNFCDDRRSPCDALLAALGEWIFGSREGYFVQVVADAKNEESEERQVAIKYCPFCGTHLESVSPLALEKFMRPRRRRRAPMPEV